jgi:hypothetical protein
MSLDEFWINEFGAKQSAKDFAGRVIRRSDSGNEQSPYGWNVDHILPKAGNGGDGIDNLQIAHIATNREKADRTSFVIEDLVYQVKKNTPKNTQGNRLAPYDYAGKKYCIVILESS